MCVPHVLWQDGRSRPSSSAGMPADGCKASDFDQYGYLEAFGVHPDWKCQLNGFASMQDRLREWQPHVMDRLIHFSCLALKVLDFDAIHIDKATGYCQRYGNMVCRGSEMCFRGGKEQVLHRWRGYWWKHPWFTLSVSPRKAHSRCRSYAQPALFSGRGRTPNGDFRVSAKRLTSPLATASFPLTDSPQRSRFHCLPLRFFVTPNV